MTLRQWREGKGLGMRELAREWGCTHPEVARLERPDVNPRLETMLAVHKRTDGAVTDWPGVRLVVEGRI